MNKPFTISVPQQNNTAEKIVDFQTEKKPGMFMPDFTKAIDTPITIVQDTPAQPEKRRRGRPSKKEQQNLFSTPEHMSGEIVTITPSTGQDGKRELSIMETNEPFDNKYQETNNILRSAIIQLDAGMSEIQSDIELIRSSKTLKNKYQYLSLLQGSMGTMIGNKIAAARELNNTITKCNDFEMKRFKEVKASADANQDDDQRIMEMYKAFVSTPVSANPLPNINQISTNITQQAGAMAIGNTDAQFDNYVKTMTPAQNMMYLGENPNVQQVVVYNQETGARYFDVIDMTTGQSVPNAEKHDAMFLEDVTIDLKNKVARNINIGETYPLVIVGQPIMDEY